MTEATATEQLDAELVLWRVFGVADVYLDRPVPRWFTTDRRGPDAGDHLQVSLGDLPDDLTLALRQWHAQKAGLLEWLIGEAGSPDDRLARYEQRLAAARPPEFDDPYPLWFTLRLSRPLSVCAIAGATLQWLRDDDERISAAFSKYEDEGNRYLDGAVARMIGAVGQMNLGHLRYSDRRAFLVAPGRAAMITPKMELSVKDSGVRVERSGGWRTAPTEGILDTLHSLPSGSSFNKGIFGPAKLFLDAQAERDVLSRFVLSYAGLEQLATQAEKGMRRELVRRIGSLDPTLPVKDLFWPSTRNDSTNRNVVFRFAVMAAMYSPSTALEDVDICRSIVDTRNDLFHGAKERSLQEQLLRCQELLRRYLGLVAASDIAGTSTSD